MLASEVDAGLRTLYFRNFGLEPQEDVRRLHEGDVPPHDLLCAGFPCQPFSKAGEQLGLACRRDGDLFGHILRVLSHRRPMMVMLENVANLERHEGGRTYRRMVADLRKLGYEVDQRVLSPFKFGIPQVRDRLFIVAAQGGLGDFNWPESNGRVPSIHDVLDHDPPDARRISDQYERCIKVWQEFLDRFPTDQELPSFPIWSMEFGADYPYLGKTPTQTYCGDLSRYRGAHGQPLRDLPPKVRMEGLPSYAREDTFADWKKQFISLNRQLYRRNRHWIDDWRKKILEFPPSLQKLEWNCKGERRVLADHILQFRASGVRVKRATAAPALIAMTTTQVPIITSQGRYMTVRECSRLQGLGTLAHLPDAPTRAYRALGNAVNADLVALVAERLIAATQGRRPTSGSGRRRRSGSSKGSRLSLVRSERGHPV